MNMRIVIIFIFAFAAIFGITIGAGFAFLRSRIAQVGAIAIDKDDVRHYVAAEACYGDKVDEKIALLNLVDAALEQEVLRLAFGTEITPVMVAERTKWIDANSKAPDILACVKTAYGNDTEGYDRWYVSPTIANPLLHDTFSHDAVIQKKARDFIDKTERELSAGKKLSSLEGYKVIDLPKPAGLAEMYTSVKQGENSGIVEDDTAYVIYEPLSEDQRNYYLGEIVSPKADFEKWLADFARKYIAISIHNGGLRASLLSNYKDVKWWVDLIK